MIATGDVAVITRRSHAPGGALAPVRE